MSQQSLAYTDIRETFSVQAAFSSKQLDLMLSVAVELTVWYVQGARNTIWLQVLHKTKGKSCRWCSEMHAWVATRLHRVGVGLNTWGWAFLNIMSIEDPPRWMNKNFSCSCIIETHHIWLALVVLGGFWKGNKLFKKVFCQHFDVDMPAASTPYWLILKLCWKSSSSTSRLLAGDSGFRCLMCTQYRD